MACPERPEGQLRDHRALVVDGSADIGGRMALGPGGGAGRAEEVVGWGLAGQEGLARRSRRRACRRHR